MPQRRRQPQNNSAAAVRMARHARVQPLRPCPETPWSVCHSCRSSRIHALLCHDIRSQGFMPSVIPAHYGNPFVGAVRRPGSCVASAMTSHLRTPSVSSVRRRPALVEIFAGVGRPELAFAPPPLTKRPLLRQRSCAEPKQLLEPAHMRRAMLSLVFFLFIDWTCRQGRRPSPPAWRRQQVPQGRACCGWQDDALYHSCRALPRQAGALVENCCPEDPSFSCAQTGRTNAGGGNESEWAHNVRRVINITHVLVWLLAVIAVTVGLSVLSVVFSILACVVNTNPDIGSNWCVAGRRAVHANMYARARV